MAEGQGGREQGDLSASSIFNHRGKLFIALALLIAALGYFAFMAFQGATVYYLTVGELNQRGQTGEEKLLRVSGKLLPESYYRDVDTILAHFSITDGSQVLKAVHRGALPDLFFNEHSEIILEGYHNPEGAFDVQTVIVKCPSKYVSVVEEG